jgi:hypothetical protein
MEREFAVGNYVEVISPDKVVKSFIAKNIFSPLNVDKLRAICKLKNGKLYKVTDVCPSCKSMIIQVGRQTFTSIYFREVLLNTTGKPVLS